MAPPFPLPPLPLQPEPIFIVVELAFTLVTVLCCLLIYLRTRESYHLTRHEGIGRFREAFLFFGLSYMLRFLFGVVLFSLFAFDIVLPRHAAMPIFMLLLGYCSTAGILLLAFGSLWRRWSGRASAIIMHCVAAALSIISFLTRSHVILLLLQTVLLLILIAGLVLEHRKGFSQTRILYLLFAAVWLLNLWALGRPPRTDFWLRVLVQVVSLAVLILIYRRVAKWVR